MTPITVTIGMVLKRAGEEIDVLVHCSVTPGQPARVAGPPERCSPGEPAEVDVLRIERTDGQPWTGDLTDDEIDRLYEKVTAQAADAESDRLADDYYEREKERDL